MSPFVGQAAVDDSVADWVTDWVTFFRVAEIRRSEQESRGLKSATKTLKRAGIFFGEGLNLRRQLQSKTTW